MTKPSSPGAFEHDVRDGRLPLGLREPQIGHPRVQLEYNAAFFQPPAQRPDHRVVLVIGRPHDADQAVEAPDHVGEAHQIAFKLHSAMPGLKCECGAPHSPEVGFEEGFVELFRNTGPAEHRLRFHRQACDAQDVPFAQTELGCRLPMAVAHQARFRLGVQRLIPRHDFTRDGPFAAQRGNRIEQRKCAQIFAFEHPATPQHIPARRRTRRIEAAADFVEFVEDGDIRAGKAAVADHESGGG